MSTFLLPNTASGQCARTGAAKTITSTQQAYVHKLLGRCERIGAELQAWAAEAIL